jgi:hypothetical protein
MPSPFPLILFDVHQRLPLAVTSRAHDTLLTTMTPQALRCLRQIGPHHQDRLRTFCSSRRARPGRGGLRRRGSRGSTSSTLSGSSSDNPTTTSWFRNSSRPAGAAPSPRQPRPAIGDPRHVLRTHTRACWCAVMTPNRSCARTSTGTSPTTPKPLQVMRVGEHRVRPRSAPSEAQEVVDRLMTDDIHLTDTTLTGDTANLREPHRQDPPGSSSA